MDFQRTTESCRHRSSAAYITSTVLREKPRDMPHELFLRITTDEQPARSRVRRPRLDPRWRRQLA
jgi:hypothetical protein